MSSITTPSYTERVELVRNSDQPCKLNAARVTEVADLINNGEDNFYALETLTDLLMMYARKLHDFGPEADSNSVDVEEIWRTQLEPKSGHLILRVVPYKVVEHFCMEVFNLFDNPKIHEQGDEYVMRNVWTHIEGAWIEEKKYPEKAMTKYDEFYEYQCDHFAFTIRLWWKEDPTEVKSP